MKKEELVKKVTRENLCVEFFLRRSAGRKKRFFFNEFFIGGNVVDKQMRWKKNENEKERISSSLLKNGRCIH